MSDKAATPSFSEKRNRQKADKLVRTATSALAAQKLPEATTSAQQALALSPDYGPALHCNAQIARAKGKLGDAAGMLQRACNLADAKIEYFHEFAGVLGAMGKFDLVQQILFAAIRRFPTHAPTYRELGVILIKAEYLSQGIEILTKAAQFDPKDWRNLINLGSALIKVGRPYEALAHLEAAEKLVANEPDALERVLLSAGEARRHLGELDQAREKFRQVLDKNPSSGRAWHDLADVTKFSKDNPEIGEMEDQFAKGADQLEKLDHEMIGFALGKAFMDCDNPERAMFYLDRANALRRSDFAYDPAKGTGYDSRTNCERVRRIKDFFPKDLFENLPKAKSAEPQYAFIVGMPRSGSTLTEQILGSHPNALPTGELRTFPKFKDKIFGPTFPSTPEDNDKIRSSERLGQLWTSYQQEVHDMYPPTDKTNVIIDKMLGNFSWAGLILLSVPGAKIIHCQRNPVDTCLSCYSKRFANLQVYTCDQTELGDFYRAYDDLMAHWRSVLPPERFIEVSYEEMVHDAKAQARRLTDFLGLPWDENVLHFQDAKRSVRTASAAQVRQGLYTTSVERWKPYEPYIQPLLAALGITRRNEEQP